MLHAVIPAGGSGTRLWPLSRAGHPKFLLRLTGGESLLQATVSRLAPLVPADRTLVVSGRPHVSAIAAQLPDLPVDNILAEPSPRDSCAAIALAAAVIARRDPDAVMGSFAADHLVRDRERFVGTIRAAVAGAEQGFLMTVGMTPTRPETGFGYLHCGQRIGDSPVREVLQFKEKPSQEVARKFVDSGEYLWNASMFVWRVEVFLAELERQQPELHHGVVRIAAAWDGPDRDDVLSAVWPNLPKIAVDYAVMEDAAARGRVATVPADFGWADVGDFRNLGELLDADDKENVVIPTSPSAPAPVLSETSGSVVAVEDGRLVALLGLQDVIVIDTPDALLVCARERAQDVKKLVDELKARGATEYL
ncbi:MAG TPA: mannose-1-phosphate guanylyltransferase [Jiangellales bacterium]|nr:mannose-1-phosphate guanylyltransferase [Jiangellales bacterium]